MFYDKTSGYGVGVDLAFDRWREAVRSLSPVHRKRILSKFSIVVYWKMMLEKIAGWSQDQVLEWVDQNHRLALFDAYSPEGSPIDYPSTSAIEWISHLLVKPELLSKFPPKSRGYLIDEVEIAISDYTRTNVYDAQYPWSGVKFAVEYVVQFWVNRGPPYVVMFDASIRDCYPREDQPQGKNLENFL